MKNRSLGPRPENGKFFCWHTWEANEWEVGPDWDLTVGLKMRARCTKCDRAIYVSNSLIKEVPDHLVNDRIVYR